RREPANDGRRRRRRRRQIDRVAGDRRRRVADVSRGAARIVRDWPPEPVRQESIGQLALERAAAVQVGPRKPAPPRVRRRRLASFASSIAHDTRDDAVNPRSGRYFSGSGQLTAQAVGSEIGFARTIVTAQTFHRLAGSGGLVFAGNARVGLAAEFEAEKPIPEPERFFAGGDTNRGFALDTLGIRLESYDQSVDPFAE